MARTFSDKSSATSLSASYYLQNFYYFNRNALKASYRKDYNKTELSYEDTRALKRAAAKLSSFHYSKEENGDNLVSTIKAFAETYNNALDSTNSKDSDIARQNKQLKALSQKYGDDLDKIGITFDKDGKMSISENILKGSTFEEIENVFSDEAKYMKNLQKIAKRMHSQSYNDIYTQITGNGERLNIIL